MIDQGAAAEESPLAEQKVQPERSRLRADPFEERIARLEDAIASLQNTQQLEERVAQRLAVQLGGKKTNPAAREGVVIEPNRPFAPPAFRAANGPADGAAGGARARLRSWLFVETLTEAHAMVRMFLDGRYRVSWIARTAPVVAVVFIVTSWLFTSWLFSGWAWILGAILDKLFDLGVIFVVYSILSREVRAYRLSIADANGLTQFQALPAVGVQKRA